MSHEKVITAHNYIKPSNNNISIWPKLKVIDGNK